MVHLFITISMLAVAASAIAQNQPSSTPGRYLGVTLPANTKSIGEHRFQSARAYEETKKEFMDRFKTGPVKKLGEEINLPHVRATLFRNTDENALFFGINVYLNVQTGLTEIFFLVNEKQKDQR